MMRKNLYVWIVIFTLIVSCSKNPFGGDTVSGGKLKITGIVLLNDGADPEGVFVWLEGFDQSAYTDADGRFELTIPAPLQQGNSVTGEYRLFYYVANYAYQTVTIVLRNGYIEYSNGGLDKNGKVRITHELIKILDIETSVLPATITRFDSTTLVRVNVRLSSYQSALKISGLLGAAPLRALMGYFFRKIDDTDNSILIRPCDRLPVVINLSGETTWKGGYMGWDMGLVAEAADWECIPYIRIIQPGMPDDLIAAIDPWALEYNEAYLKIPCRQDLGRISCVLSQ
ncbi:hypothetical protein KAR48_18640 [bacterium]|nr:hypothetical protein [bacterium]